MLGQATALACPDTFVFVFVFVFSQYYVFVFDTWYVVVVAGAVYTCQQVVGRATRTLPFFFLVPIFGRASSRAPDRLTSFKLPLQPVLTFLPFSIFLLLQISAFFLFSNFRKRQIALYSPCRLVGWSVGWLVDVTIIFFPYIEA